MSYAHYIKIRRDIWGFLSQVSVLFKLWQFECKKKGEVFNKPFLFLCVCFCVCVSIPADYPPPPPPVEDSTSFPPSSGSFPPPPMNSYDYQVREKCCCIKFSWLSVTLWKSAQKAETAQSWVHVTSPAKLSVHLSCSQLQRWPAPDASWSQPPQLETHTQAYFLHFWEL